jgi:hypothetical protein
MKSSRWKLQLGVRAAASLRMRFLQPGAKDRHRTEHSLASRGRRKSRNPILQQCLRPGCLLSSLVSRWADVAVHGMIFPRDRPSAHCHCRGLGTACHIWIQTDSCTAALVQED